MARISPDSLIHKINGLGNTREATKESKPEINKVQNSVVKELRERPSLEEAEKLSAEIVNPFGTEEGGKIADAHGSGLTEDRVRALLFDDEEE